MSFDYETLRAKTQRTLVDFLNVELKLGPTFVQTALIAKDQGHMDHYAQAKRSAIKAADSVRRFMGQVADAKAKAKIGKQLAELDRLVSTL